MSRAARTVFVFGLYVMALGFMLLVCPEFLLGLFRQPVSGEVWVRVCGALCLYLGAYYIMAARAELEKFFLWTVFGRGTVIVFFCAFVVAGLAHPVFIAFGLVDLLGALWTLWAIRKG